MGTAPKKPSAARHLARPAADANVPASMEFLIFADNGGSYHWRLRADDGAILGDSGGFASYDDAEHAAQQVSRGAGSARFAPRTASDLRADRASRGPPSSFTSRPRFTGSPEIGKIEIRSGTN